MPACGHGSLKVRGASLSQPDLDQLVADLRTVAGKTLPAGSLTYGIFSGERERLARAIVTLISDEATGRPIAFNALSVMSVELDGEPEQVTHLGLVMIDPDVQGQGLSWVLYGLTTLVLFARDGLRPKWISNVTQVPAVFGMVCDTFSDVFPSPHAGARRSFAHLQLARGIMREHRAVFGVGGEAGFDEQRFVITDAYTGGSDALKKTYRRRAKTSRRAIQCVLRPRTRLRQGRRFASAWPHRSRRCPPLSAARCAGRLDAGAACSFRRSGVAAADPSRRSLVRRCPRVRRLAAVAREWPMISGAMTSGVIANSIVNLCGAIGLGVAMFALHRRDPRSPLTQRLLVMLGIAAILFFTRGVAWWTGSVWLDRLSLIPAAAVPLGALIVTEGILRRHAPKAIKIVALAGAVLFGLGGVFGLESYPTSYSIALSLFQLAGFAACAWLLATRDRGTLLASENRAIGRLVAGAIMVIPFIVTDFRALAPDIPVRLGALGALLVVTAVLIAGGGSETRRQGILMTALRLAERRAAWRGRCLRIARRRCRAGHALLRHRDLGRADDRPDDRHAARLVRGRKCRAC